MQVTNRETRPDGMKFDYRACGKNGYDFVRLLAPVVRFAVPRQASEGLLGRDEPLLPALAQGTTAHGKSFRRHDVREPRLAGAPQLWGGAHLRRIGEVGGNEWIRSSDLVYVNKRDRQIP